MNILGLHIGSYAAVKRRELDLSASISALDASFAREKTLRATLESTKSELTSALNRVEGSNLRESDLQRRLDASEAQVVAAQNVRLEHNNLLFRVGKNWLEFKKAWQFRKDNPKMNPKERIANNETLDRSITAVDAYLPKKILDPSEKAIADIAGDADPSPEPYASNPRAG